MGFCVRARVPARVLWLVDSAERYADDAGFFVKVLEDCCVSPDPELHRIEIEKILPLFAQITASEELLRTL